MNGIKHVAVVSFGCFLLSASSFAFAAESFPTGWYVEGNLGKSYSSNKSAPGRVKNTGLGWNLNGGYKFNPYVGVDVGFTHYAESRFQTPAGTTVATDQHYSYDLAAKLMLPVWKTGLEIFGKVGIARLHSYTTLTNQGAANVYGYAYNTGTHSTNGPYFGAGAQYAFMPCLLANVQWMRTNGSAQTGNLSLASAGLSYIF